MYCHRIAINPCAIFEFKRFIGACAGLFVIWYAVTFVLSRKPTVCGDIIMPAAVLRDTVVEFESNDLNSKIPDMKCLDALKAICKTLQVRKVGRIKHTICAHGAAILRSITIVSQIFSICFAAPTVPARPLPPDHGFICSSKLPGA